LLDWLLDLELSRGNRAAIDGENSAIKRELAEVESASVSPAGKLDLAIEISRSYQINNVLKNPFLEEFLLVGRSSHTQLNDVGVFPPQVESLSFGRVPELIESSHIWIQIAKSLSYLCLE